MFFKTGNNQKMRYGAENSRSRETSITKPLPLLPHQKKDVRPLPPVPPKKKESRPLPPVPPVPTKKREQQTLGQTNEARFSVSEPADYIEAHKFLCTSNQLPETLKGLSAPMIMKMADVFEIKDKSSTKTVCELVDAKIRKSQIMNNISLLSLNCKQAIDDLNKEKQMHTSDVQDTIKDEMDALLNMYSHAQTRFEDESVTPEAFESDLKTFQNCQKLVRNFRFQRLITSKRADTFFQVQTARDSLKRASASTRDRYYMTSEDLEAKKQEARRSVPKASPDKEPPFYIRLMDWLFK